MKPTVFGSAVAAVFLAMLAGQFAQAENGAATPEETFASFQTAIKNKDYKQAFDHLTPQSQDLMLAAMAMPLSFNLMSPEAGDKSTSAKKVFQKHKLKPLGVADLEAMHRRPQDRATIFVRTVSEVKDKPACFADIVAWMEANRPKNADGPEKPTPVDEMASAQLSGLKVEGDAARGTIKSSSEARQSIEQPVKFKKISGNWLIELELPED